MDKKPPIIQDHSDEEEARIQAAIAKDPDTWEVPMGAKVRRRGRPRGSNKSQVTIKLDNAVLEALKTPAPKGWQTRANAILRQALGV